MFDIEERTIRENIGGSELSFEKVLILATFFFGGGGGCWKGGWGDWKGGGDSASVSFDPE